MVNSKCRSFLLVVFGLLFLLQVGPAAAQTKPADNWRDTGLQLPLGSPEVCFDTTQPDVLLVASKNPDSGPPGTLAYNLRTGQRTRLNDRPFTDCNEANGLLFVSVRGVAGALRFSGKQPNPTAIKYSPTAQARDGSLRLYAVDDKRLFASADGGDSWEERAPQYSGSIQEVAVAPADASSVFMLTKTKLSSEESLYTLYYSLDSGQSWGKNYEYRATANVSLKIGTAELSRLAPLRSLLLEIQTKQPGEIQSKLYFSGDAGLSFNELTEGELGGKLRKVYFSNAGLLRFRNNYTRRLTLEISTDNAKTWQPLSVPPMILPLPSPDPKEDFGKAMVLQQAENAPTNLFLSNTDGTDVLWYSPDGGKAWKELDRNMTDVLVSPYAPHYLVGIRSRKIYVLKLPQADKTVLNSVLPGANYFAPTGQNLAPAFKNFWEKRGGLEQFGYPRTIPFREVNSSDGQVYLMQYFERNRFEYHPENTPAYEVLLGLLGNQLTEERRSSEEAFKPTNNKNYPGGIYFGETAHNLRGSFLSYWAQNGGLSVYGYPVSEEFEELNPDDGRNYLVQYFERNRLELHPENRGTKYEVLLGLLGNTVLRSKGWLPV